MDASGAAGNPNAASSDSLPAEEENQHTRECVSLSWPQKHQSPVETPELPDHIKSSHQQHSPPAMPNSDKLEHTCPGKLDLLSARHESEDSCLIENPPPPNDQAKPDPTKLHRRNTEQKKPGSLPVPESEHEPVHSQDHLNQNDFCLVDMENEEDPPPTLEDLTKGLKELQVSESRDKQNHEDPLPEKLPSPTPDRHGPRLVQNTQQTPPTNQQNILLSTTHPLILAPPGPPLTIETLCDQVRPSPSGSAGEPRLCGYLQKQGGPLRAWKQRWFTYEEKKNQLFYYRTPQDVMPLGKVELSGATFTYPLQAEKGTFHIKTPERTFILKAVTQELMLYWLQQLQVKRWQHRQIKTSTEKTKTTTTAGETHSQLESEWRSAGCAMFSKAVVADRLKLKEKINWSDDG